RAEADLFGAVDDGGEEHQGRSDALAEGAEVLAHERLAEAEAIGEHDGFLVLGEQRTVVAIGMVKGHGEHAELDGHGGLLCLISRDATTSATRDLLEPGQAAEEIPR